MKRALAAASATSVGGRLLADDPKGRLSKGDAALLRFAAAAEILEVIFGCSTTKSEEPKTRKCQVGVEILSTLLSFKILTRTSRNTS